MRILAPRGIVNRPASDAAFRTIFSIIIISTVPGPRNHYLFSHFVIIFGTNTNAAVEEDAEHASDNLTAT